MIQVSKCQCGHRVCQDWHVEGFAAVQGVKFTEQQARAVAQMLGDSKMVSQLAATHYREAEVQALRAEVKRLEFVLRGYRETTQELMEPRGAADVLENWLASQIGEEAEALRKSLLAVCKKEGWE